VRFQKVCPLDIVGGLCQVGVNAPVHLDFELMGDAEGIKDEAVVGMLPPELQPGQTAVSQRRPQLLFGWGRLASLLASGVNDRGGSFAACFFWAWVYSGVRGSRAQRNP